MRILALETATPLASVAVVDRSGILGEAVLRAPMHHLEWLLPTAHELLRGLGPGPAAIDAIAVSRGPGGFTGLRIGIATAAAWARTRGIPVLGVGTLEALALVPGAEGLVLPVLDAHRGEVAGALYRVAGRDRAECLIPPLVASPDVLAAEVAAHPGPVLLLGDGLARYGPELLARLGGRARSADSHLHPRAGVVGLVALPRLERGERADPLALAPQYGRRPIVWPRKETPGGTGIQR